MSYQFFCAPGGPPKGMKPEDRDTNPTPVDAAYLLAQRLDAELVSVRAERDGLRKACQLGLDAINASLTRHISITKSEILAIRDEMQAAIGPSNPPGNQETQP